MFTGLLTGVVLKMQKKVTIRDIARIAKVSPSTVSLVLNNKKGIGEETRYRVLRIAGELQYTPNLVARSLAKKRTDIIALAIRHTPNALFMEIAAGVDEVIKEWGYSMIMFSTYDDIDLEAKEFAIARAHGVDGFLVASALIDSRCIPQLVDEEVPLVSVLRRVPGVANLNYVAEGSFKGGYLAGEHLIKLGHTRIGILKGHSKSTTGIDRLKGAISAMEDHDIPVDEKLIMNGEFSKEAAYLATLAVLRKPDSELPSAIYACNDDMAMGAFEAALDCGLRVPEDIALVGFNNVKYTSLKTVGLTTIDVQAHEMGRRGATRLMEMIKSGKGYQQPLQVVLEPTLIVRKSCGQQARSAGVE